MRQSSPPRALTRCGVACPTTMAPTRMPRAVPRPFWNHVAISLRAGGYTPARKNPVAKRSPTPIAPAPASSSSAFAVAAPIAPAQITCRGAKRSERLSRPEVSAPHTKPSWTAIVSHAAVLADSPHSVRSRGTTAAAENHVVIDSTSVTASSASARQRPAAWSGAGLGVIVVLREAHHLPDRQTIGDPSRRADRARRQCARRACAGVIARRRRGTIGMCAQAAVLGRDEREWKVGSPRAVRPPRSARSRSAAGATTGRASCRRRLRRSTASRSSSPSPACRRDH